MLQLSRDHMGFLPLLYYSPAALIWGSACAYGRLWRECRHASHLLVESSDVRGAARRTRARALLQCREEPAAGLALPLLPLQTTVRAPGPHPPPRGVFGSLVL